MKKNERITDKDFSRMKKVENNHRKYVKNGFYLSYSARVVLMFVIFLLIGIISYNCFNISFEEGIERRLMYEEKSAIDYDVSLLPGNPYETGGLTPSEFYISEAISSISTDFNYLMELSENVDAKYTYYVVAETKIINKKNGNVLSNRDDILISKIEKNINDTSKIDLTQNVNIDYKNYNDNALLVKNQYAIESEGQITIKMIIDMELKYQNFTEPVTKTEEIKATIPLLATEVKPNLENPISNTDMFSEKSATKLSNKLTLYIGIALLIIDAIYILLIIGFLLKAKPKKTKYCILRDGLLRDYDDIIVNSRNIPKFTGSNLIDCYNFQELLDAQRLLKKPIVYCEIVKNQKALFMIINGDDAYKYTLKEVDLDF